MTLNKLPEDTTHYWAWRVHVLAELIQHVPFETEAGRLFVEELDTSTFDELGDVLPPVLTAIDSKFYGALLTAVQPHHAALVMRISTIARQGCGRHQLRGCPPAARQGLARGACTRAARPASSGRFFSTNKYKRC